MTFPAQAGLSRAWVSSKGSDTPSCGALASPCRQIKYVLDNALVSPGGEIDILDPAGFAPFTISQEISVINDGVGTASVQQTTAGQSAITINTNGPAKITLKGLSIDGRGAGANGVLVSSSFPMGVAPTYAGEINILDCVIKNFADNGIAVTPVATGSGMFQPNLDLTVANTLVLRNGANGMLIFPPNGPLVVVATTLIRNSVFKNNAADGLKTDGFGGHTTMIEQSTLYRNGANGLNLRAGVSTTVKHSTIMANAYLSAGKDIYAGAPTYLFDNNTIGTLQVDVQTVTDGTNNVLTRTGATLTPLSRQ
ncbi:right-handed parallel beta-helix repeat-containing protein [Methylocystis parvus]|uniref:right-handed parallel beta-helix repeat-containing protein n=1 Tax=Methylocystis parvus TaxID=134 RepID=UPI003C7084DB